MCLPASRIQLVPGNYFPSLLHVIINAEKMKNNHWVFFLGVTAGSAMITNATDRDSSGDLWHASDNGQSDTDCANGDGWRRAQVF